VTADTREVGRRLEAHCLDRWALEDANAEAEQRGYDAVTRRPLVWACGAALRPAFRRDAVVDAQVLVECKAAKYRIEDGSSGPRRGRFYITATDRDAADAYALGVYTDDEGVLADATAVLPADVVHAAAGSWTSTGSRTTQEAARIPWAEFFDPEVVG
jgi:hypothetical protein